MQVYFIVQNVLHVLAPPEPSSRHRHIIFYLFLIKVCRKSRNI